MIQNDQTRSKIIQWLCDTHALELPKISRQFDHSLWGHPVSDEQLRRYNSEVTRTYPSKRHRTLQTYNRISDFVCRKVHARG